jgi:hypothetical protein
MKEMRNAYRILVIKPEGKKPLRRTRCRWEDNVRMDHGRIWWGRLDWIHLTQGKD